MIDKMIMKKKWWLEEGFFKWTVSHRCTIGTDTQHCGIKCHKDKLPAWEK